MLHLHVADRTDRLVARLADLIVGQPLADPMATEVVAVNSRGVERWIAQQLAQRLGTSDAAADGVCANVDFPFPGRMVVGALATATGVDPDRDPWRPERLVWPLLEVIDAVVDDDAGLAPLRLHLRGPGPAGRDDAGRDDAGRQARRFRAARHLADLFDRYAVHRPALLQRWAAGDARDVDGAALDDDVAWQAALWRRVRAHVDIPSPAERLDDGVAALRAGAAVDLPERVALFGLTALPPSYLQILDALAVHRDVHLLLLHPSPGLWQALARIAAALAGQAAPDRDADPSRELVRAPLLASWGRDAREMQVVLAARGLQEGRLDGEDEAADDGGRGDGPRPLLAQLQADVRANRAPPGAPLAAAAPDDRLVLDAADDSVQLHACYGRARQVEALRDTVLHLLAADPTLEPRDVIVMCPDIEAFAPLVDAVFNRDRGEADDAVDLRVRLADRSLRQTNPLLRVAASLLALADARATSSELLDVAAAEPVRRRFGFDDEALDRLETWVADAGIRWGLDADHRAELGLPPLAANTWRAGLDRLLLGVAMADEDERVVGGVTPLDDVEGGDVELAGRLAELVDRIAWARASLRAPQPVGDWCEALRHAVDLVAEPPVDEAWQRAQLGRILDEVVDEARVDDEPSEVHLSLPEVRALLDGRLAGRPSRASHRTGDLTVCTLVPMRSVPHRVVCLLGLDDGAFPRRAGADGDDLVDRQPRVGDRDRRTEDRQLLLDALMAAGDHLVVTYAGRDERTGEPRPPAVPITELVDVIDRTVRTADGGRVSDAIRIDHPLHAADPANFTPGGLARAHGGPGGTAAGGRRWSFDDVALAGARASRDARPWPDLVDAPLPPEPPDPVELELLERFVRHPARTFCQHRLGLSLPGEAREPDDAVPVELDGLARWHVGSSLLQARRHGIDPHRWECAARGRGVLPPGPLAEPTLAEVRGHVDAITACAADAGVDPTAPSRPVDVDVTLPGGRGLVGVVEACHDAVVELTYSRLKGAHRLTAWVRLLAAAVAEPDRPWRAVVVGRSWQRDRDVAVCELDPPGDPDVALAELVALLDRGLREPLPLPAETAAAWATARHAERSPHRPARFAWAGSGPVPGEDVDAAHVLCFGADRSLEDLLALRPAPHDADDGFADEPSRFGRLARRLWEPLLACEELTHR